MSYIEAECSWCGEKYTFGVVGTTFVGSGHTCSAVEPCETQDCSERGVFLVDDARERSFRCQAHIGILDGVADGESLTDEERAEVRVLRERLKTAIERHNARGERP